MRTSTVRAFALGICTGSLIAAATIIVAAPAKADPDRVSLDYAQRYGWAVCATLDDFPSFAGVVGVGESINDDGLSWRQAGYVLAVSVSDRCPRHLALLKAFAAQDSGVVA
jgi:hypothetical protein